MINIYFHIKYIILNTFIQQTSNTLINNKTEENIVYSIFVSLMIIDVISYCCKTGLAFQSDKMQNTQVSMNDCIVLSNNNTQCLKPNLNTPSITVLISNLQTARPYDTCVLNATL